MILRVILLVIVAAVWYWEAPVRADGTFAAGGLKMAISMEIIQATQPGSKTAPMNRKCRGWGVAFIALRQIGNRSS